MPKTKNMKCPLCGDDGLIITHGYGWYFGCVSCPVSYGVGALASISFSGDKFISAYHGAFRTLRECKKAVKAAFKKDVR
jgi:ssDNA-binding Zn-finger/Zn-ribbon topoisomerase 1